MYVVSRDYNWTHDLITSLIKRHKPVVLDQTKRSEHHAAGQVKGIMEGISLALTAYGTSVRLSRLPSLPGDGRLSQHYPAVEYHTVHKLLKQMLEDWDGGMWTDQPDEKFFDWFDTEYNKIIDESAPEYEMRRKTLVRTGEMEPQPGDEEWLVQEANEAIKAAQPLRDLAAKAKALNA